MYKSTDYRSPPSEMAPGFIGGLAFELYARACSLNCSKRLYERAMEIKNEVQVRLYREANQQAKIDRLAKKCDGLTLQIAEQAAEVERLRDALERTLNMCELLLKRKPVRDVTETLWEARNALSQPRNDDE